MLKAKRKLEDEVQNTAVRKGSLKNKHQDKRVGDKQLKYGAKLTLEKDLLGPGRHRQAATRACGKNNAEKEA